MIKTCKTCGETKPKDEFPKNRSLRCKVCSNTRHAIWYKANRERVLLQRKSDWYERNKVEINRRRRAAYHDSQTGMKQKTAEAGKQWRRMNPDKAFARRLKYNYGLSIDDYVNMKTAQNGKCKICKKDVELVVDHDHTTGRVRGLLCSPCNSTLGLSREDISILESAIVYLKEHDYSTNDH